MVDDMRRELAKYRVSQAEQCLHSAKALLEINDFRGAANRAYYAIYHAIRGVIACDGVEFKKHSGNISYFRQNYIATGIFDKELSDMITISSDARSGSDYDDFFIISKDEVKQQIVNAEIVLGAIKKYLKEKNGE